MTKKDYIVLADAIKNFKNNPDCNTNMFKRNMADVIGEALAKENYRFDWNKWEAYIFPKAG